MSESSIAGNISQIVSDTKRDIDALQSPHDAFKQRREEVKSNHEKAFDEWDKASLAGDLANLKEVLGRLRSSTAELERLLPPGPREEQLYKDTKQKMLQDLRDKVNELIDPPFARENSKNHSVGQQPSPQEECSHDWVEPTPTASVSASVSTSLGFPVHAEPSLGYNRAINSSPLKSPSSVSVFDFFLPSIRIARAC